MAGRKKTQAKKQTEASIAVAVSQKAAGNSNDTDIMAQTSSESGKVRKAGSAAAASNEQGVSSPGPPPQENKDSTATVIADSPEVHLAENDKQEVIVGGPEVSTPSSLRPIRKRAAPIKYTGTEGVEIAETPKTPAVKRPKIDKSWSEDFLLRNSHSRFGKVNLLPFFTNDRALSSFTNEEKNELSSLVPPHFLEPDDEDPSTINRKALQYDVNFRFALRCFADDLSAGRYDPEWIRQADEAMQARARGDYDDYKERHFEEFWGQKQDPPARTGGRKGLK